MTSATAQLLQAAMEHYGNGLFAEAEKLCREVLRAEPENAYALRFLALMMLRLGRAADAAVMLERARQLLPNDANVLNDLGEAYRLSNRLTDAEACLRQALSLAPEQAPAYINLGSTLAALGALEEADQCYRRALALAPQSPEAHNNLGVLLRTRGHLEEAVRVFRRGLALRPSYAHAHNNLGVTLHDLGFFTEAEQSCRQALRLDPAYAEASYNLGNTLAALGRAREAEASYRRALELGADKVEVCVNLGLLLVASGRPTDAEQIYRRAMALYPERPEPHNNLGTLLADLGRRSEAAEAFRHALRLRPDYPEAQINFAHQCQHLCAWDEVAALVPQIRQRVARRRPGLVSPFSFLSLPDTTPAEQRECARAFAEATYARCLARPPLSSLRRPADESRLRIGYLSADYCAHPTSYLLAEVIELHDRDRFAIFGYSHGADDGSAVRQRLKQSFDVFRDFRSVASEAAAQQIAGDDIHILIDLKGYTRDNRLDIVARRPAFVQASWLGYPGTLGHPLLADYIVGDPIVTPLEHERRYSERIASMPHCYQPNDRKRVVADAPSREDAGLPPDAFVFCCLNQSYKITPAIFDVWCRLLARIPHGVLWLLGSDAAAQVNLARQAAGRGVDPGRLIFAPRIALPQHLARLQLADLALDTFPVTSHTTASDALWAGVPLVTMIGEAFCSRVAASVCAAAGMAELVVRDLAKYERLSLQLASNAARLQALRRQLVANRPVCPLFDSRRFTRDLERLFSQMWANHVSGRHGHITATSHT